MMTALLSARWIRSARRSCAVLGACAIVGAAPVGAAPVGAQASVPAVQPDTALTAEEAAALAAEEARYAERAMALRDRIVRAGTIRAMGTDKCDPGSLRVFDGLTDLTARAEVERAVWQLERLILARGVGASLDDARGHALLAAVMQWEGGDRRPRWDADGAAPRAIAPGLMGEFPDPETGACVRAREIDTMTFWIPALEAMPLPGRETGPVRKVYFGADGVRQARDEFFAAYGADSASILEYVHVAPVVRWDDWAVVGVNRPAERQGVVVGAEGAGTGGASYLFRWVDGEWRLVAIARAWG